VIMRLKLAGQDVGLLRVVIFPRVEKRQNAQKPFVKKLHSKIERVYQCNVLLDFSIVFEK
jgi:hypothetical protein